MREVLARSIDRGSIVNFILHKDDEPAGGLPPQWSRGAAFLFLTAANAAGAKEMWPQIASAPRLMLGYDSGDTFDQWIAERIMVNAREAGIYLTMQGIAAASSAKVDARDADPLPESATPMEIYRREQTIVSGHRVVPIAWLPHVYGLSARVRDWTPPDAGAAWPLANVWLDGEQQ